MQTVELDDLYRLADKFDRICRELPEKKRELHEKIAVELEAQVKANVGGTGKVASWQEKRVGSKGGYAAVSARAKAYQGNYALGYITNAIENGHTVRKPKKPSKYYKSRVKYASVKGKQFYYKTRSQAERTALNLCHKFTEELTKEISGD